MSALNQHPGVSYLNPRRGRACIRIAWSGHRGRYRGLVRGRGGAIYWIPRTSWADWRYRQPSARTAPV